MLYILIRDMVDDMLNQFDPKKHGLFSQKKKPDFGAPSVIPDQLTELSRRLRTLEGRYTNLQTKTQVIEQNMISSYKRLLSEIKTTNSDVREVKKEFQEIKERILSLIQELQSCAKKEEIKVLQKYVHLWEPMNFVTREEVEELMEEKKRKH
jgi:uncharacterized protein (DUF342 family)